MTTHKRRAPVPTPETAEFWAGTRKGELRLQRCTACAHVYFPARPFCPGCASRDVAWFTASGRGTLYSYVINERPAPGFTAPYSIAVVELDEGPRMMTNIVDCDFDKLKCEQPVKLVFKPTDGGPPLPMFTPA